MTFPRHSTRHVQATVLNRVKDAVTALGWTVEADLPFGTEYAAVVTFVDFPAIANDKLAEGVGPGTVACTMGPEFNPDEQEMGGPLSLQEYPIFFDIFQSTYATTTALANDVRDTLMGRFDGTKRSFPIIDQTNDSEIPGWICELTDVEIVRPEIHLPLHWQVVKVTASVFFLEEQW